MLISSCKVFQPSKMLKTGKDYVFDELPQDTINPEYNIKADDILEIRLFANDGFKMLELMEGSNANQNFRNNQQGFSYIVEYDGAINLPILGRVSVAGLTARECEFFLEEKYATFYVNPFVVLSVTNRKVIIFPGEPGQAQVLTLTSGQTTLLEALAMTGGIRQEGKAYDIKLIRGDIKDPLVYHIDLSKIENLHYANLVLESDDIIYIEQRVRPAREVLAELQPLVSLSTTLFTLVTSIILWRSL